MPAEETETRLNYPLRTTGCVTGAMACLTALRTAERVCVASGQIPIVACIMSFQLTGEFRRPVMLLLLLRLFAEPSATCPP
jgi:hypothetical protein